MFQISIKTHFQVALLSLSPYTGIRPTNFTKSPLMKRCHYQLSWKQVHWFKGHTGVNFY